MSAPAAYSDPLLRTRALKRAAPAHALEGQEASVASEDENSDALPPLCKADIARDDLTGLSLGQYALGPKIGGGGMGKVFAARHRRLDRRFAIKFLSHDVSPLTDAPLRFEQEVRALGKLQHPNIVNAVDAGCLNGVKYLVTELVDGEDLAQLVQRRGPLPVAEACELIRQAAVGLAYSHARGFVHRDIKPSNLILNRSGVVIILDFGLVRSLHFDAQLTEDGAMLGTWDFLAPEQAHDARDVDSRCDLYSLGCTLIYLLSGEPPFNAERYATPAAKLKAHLFDRPPWLDRLPAGIPPELAAVLERLLKKSPAERYATADEVAAALAPFTSYGRSSVRKETSVPPRRRSGRSGHPTNWAPPGVVIALSIALGGGLFFFRESPTEARNPTPENEVPTNEVQEPAALAENAPEPPIEHDVDSRAEPSAKSGLPDRIVQPRLKTLESRPARDADLDVPFPPLQKQRLPAFPGL